MGVLNRGEKGGLREGERGGGRESGGEGLYLEEGLVRVSHSHRSELEKKTPYIYCFGFLYSLSGRYPVKVGHN